MIPSEPAADETRVFLIVVNTWAEMNGWRKVRRHRKSMKISVGVVVLHPLLVSLLESADAKVKVY